MKAILVIDCDEIEKCEAEVYIYINDKLYEVFYNVKLQPMPQIMSNSEWYRRFGGQDNV